MTETTVELAYVCFYCGGNADFQPSYIPVNGNGVWSRTVMEQPCAGCRSIMEIGITFFEVDKEEITGRVGIGDGVFLTGRWNVVSPARCVKLLGPVHAERIIAQRHAMVTIEQYKMGKLDVRPESIH